MSSFSWLNRFVRKIKDWVKALILTRFHLRDVNEMILRGRSQHLTIVAEAQSPRRPIQPAGELVIKDWDLHTTFGFIQSFHRLTWRSSEHTPVPPRPTGWPGHRCCPWRSTSPWGQTWCRCSLTGERWWTGWSSAPDNCEQKLMLTAAQKRRDRREELQKPPHPAETSTCAGKDWEDSPHNQSNTPAGRSREGSCLGGYLRILMQPPPLVRKNMSLSLFQEISFTSNLKCSSALEQCVLASMKVTTSSLLPTAMVWPSGLQQMLMFSPENVSRQKQVESQQTKTEQMLAHERRVGPLVLTVAMHLVVLTSHIRMVLSPDAVTNRSGLVGCQQSWSTLSPCPL